MRFLIAFLKYLPLFFLTQLLLFSFLFFSFFFLVHTCFFLQSKQTLLLMALEISEAHVTESISCAARETIAQGYLQRRNSQKLSGLGILMEAVC